MSLQTELRPNNQAFTSSSEATVHGQLAGDAALEQRAPFFRRFAAYTIYDYICCLWLATIAVVACRILLGADGPRLTAHAPIQMFTLFIFLFRDSFFNGRGLGKGLLGLAVVDRQTKRPATIVQSLQRNLVFLAPYFVYQLTALMIPANTSAAWAHNLLAVLQIFAVTYCFVVMLIETVLMLRGNGLRLADRLSGTMVVKLNTEEPC